MADLAYGYSAYQRDRGNLPELPLINLFVEPTPTNERGIVLQSRPGMSAGTVAMGSGPVRALFQADGVFSGNLFGVSGGSLYRGATSLGSVAGSLVPSFAATELEVLVAAGGSITRYNGTAVNNPTFPDSASVIKILFIAGLFVAIRADTQRFYWSAVLDGNTWDGLDFATAENEPDRLVDGLVLDDVLILAGTQTIEFWPKTGDADIPFAPTQGRLFERGVIATGCLDNFDNSFAWIGENGIVYRAGNVPERISTDGIEERIAESTTYRAFRFFFEGHEFFCVRLDGGTVAYDAATRQWCEFANYGLTNWQAQCAVPGPVFGSATDGATLVFNDTHSDLGGVLERRFRAGFPLAGGRVRADNIRLRVNSGQTPNLTGQYAQPVVEMRLSRDAAQTWSSWRQAQLGVQGDYRARVEWRVVGLFDEPGGVFEFRCTDPVPFRVAGAYINEPYGGRSR